MFQVDYYAYSNRLASVHPVEKSAFTLITLVICLISSALTTYLAVTVLMAGAVVLRAKIPLKFYLRLIMVPASFILLSVATVAVSFSIHSEGFLTGLHLGKYYAGISRQDLETASLLFFRSLGATSCLFFLALTTPMIEVINILKRLKTPVIIIEIMGLVYRFIFVLVETAGFIYTSQSSRLGYKGIRSGYRSMGKLIASLFIRAYSRSEWLYTTMSSRAFTGEIRVLDSQYRFSWSNVLTIIMIEAMLALLSLAEVSGGGLVGRIYY